MKRRETIKSLLIGGVAGTTLSVSTFSCKSDETQNAIDIKGDQNLYGRTPSEIEHDKSVNLAQYYNEHELSTISVLCDIILPATATAGSATEAGVPEFIEFISKDLPNHQIPMRGGMMWLDGESNKRFNKRFVDCNETEQISIVDDIAYPDKDNKYPYFGPGRSFFNRIRNLTLTGYYTTKMGIDDLGYVGNRPNMWDGVPQEVLDKHGLSYDNEWLSKFVDHEKSNEMAKWDDDGNLIS